MVSVLLKRTVVHAICEVSKYKVNCDNCKHYHWYYDYCDKWDCEMDARACNSCFEARENAENGCAEEGEAE